MSDWNDARLREFADAEIEALDGCDGLLACSPELWDEMNTAYVVLIRKANNGVEAGGIFWDEEDARRIANEFNDSQKLSSRPEFAYFNRVVFQPRPKKFSEIVQEENRIFPGYVQDEHFFIDVKGPL